MALSAGCRSNVGPGKKLILVYKFHRDESTVSSRLTYGRAQKSVKECLLAIEDVIFLC